MRTEFYHKHRPIILLRRLKSPVFSPLENRLTEAAVIEIDRTVASVGR